MRYHELFENADVIRDAINWNSIESYEWIEEEAYDSLGIELQELTDEQFQEFISTPWYKNHLYNTTQNTYNKLLDMFENGKIQVSREITADRWTPNIPIGVYWSWGQASAYCEDPDLKNYYLFRTHVEENQIDWPATIWKNSPWGLHEEQEIHVLDGTKINLEKIYVKKDCSEKYKLINPEHYIKYTGTA